MADVPFGFINSGGICYFNTMLQAVISCPTVLRFPTAINDQPSTQVGMTFKVLLSMINSGKIDGIQGLSAQLVGALAAQLKTKGSTYIFQQEDAGEFFGHLINELDTDNMFHGISRLFNCGILTEVKCSNCSFVISKVSSELILFVGSNLKVEETSVLTDYTCDNCHLIGTCTLTKSIDSTGDILVIHFRDKYINPDIVINYPVELQCKDIIYKVVAQVHHSGGLSGGHYYVSCTRGLGKVYTIDDAHVHPNFVEAHQQYLNVCMLFLCKV